MTEKPKRPRGRPKGTTKPEDQKHTYRLHVWLTPEEGEIYETLGPEWVREQIRKAR